MTGVTAENRLLAWQTLQMTGETAENAYLLDKLYK
jgi:hypothetical protein